MAEAITKVSDAPANLCASIAFMAQGQDGVAISLRDRIAMTATITRAFVIGIDDTCICIRMFSFDPAQQGRSKVEVDVGVVINDSLLICCGPGRRVGDARTSIG